VREPVIEQDARTVLVIHVDLILQIVLTQSVRASTRHWIGLRKRLPCRRRDVAPAVEPTGIALNECTQATIDEAITDAGPDAIVVRGTILSVVITLEHGIVVQPFGGLAQAKVDVAADAVGVHRRGQGLRHLDAREHVGRNETETGRPVRRRRRKLDAVDRHRVVLRLDAPDDDLVAVLEGNPGQPAHRCRRTLVGKLTDALRRDDVGDGPGTQLLIDGLELSLRLGGDQDFSAFDTCPRQFDLYRDFLPGNDSDRDCSLIISDVGNYQRSLAGRGIRNDETAVVVGGSANTRSLDDRVGPRQGITVSRVSDNTNDAPGLCIGRNGAHYYQERKRKKRSRLHKRRLGMVFSGYFASTMFPVFMY